MLDAKFFKKHAPRLSRHAFAAFVALFHDSNPKQKHDPFSPLREVGEDAFYHPYRDSYGSSIHDVYLLHCPPFELFQNPTDLNLQDPILVQQLKNIVAMYKGRKGQWGMMSPFLDEDNALKGFAFLTNLSGFNLDSYRKKIIPAYTELAKMSGLRNLPYVGSCDSFVDIAESDALAAFEKFLESHCDGLVISLGPNNASASTFAYERNLEGGALFGASHPYEPVYVSETQDHASDVVRELDELIQNSSVERRIEEFLVDNYKLLFGYKYDRIETQLWLRCPEVDLGKKDRRIDLFLRNSTSNDWELFEVKRPVPLVRSVRDVPVISRHLVEAIHQVKNYAKILSEDKVKRYFSTQGIEYFEPRLSIVIGRTPQIPTPQWRWLKTTNENGVTIFTFDELRSELKARLAERHELLSSVQIQKIPKNPKPT